MVKPNGYWKEWKNVEDQLRISIEDNEGKFPSQNYLKSNGLHGLKSAIEKHHGGMPAVRQKLGFQLVEKPKGHWQNWEIIKVELEEVIEEISHFPTAGELKELGKDNVLNAISRYFDGINSVRERMGYTSDLKPRGYWQDWDNVEPELVSAIDENGGVVPTYCRLNDLGRSDLAHAIQRHHGGINKVRKKLGQKISKRENNAFKDIEYAKKQIDEIIEAHPELNGEFPSAWWLQQNGYATIYMGIRVHHGGYRKFRESIGEEQASLENGTRKNLDYVLDEAREIIDSHEFSELPGQWTLRKLGYSSFCSAIGKYHGGMTTFRERLRNHLGQPSEKSELEDMLTQYAGGQDE